MTTPILTEPPGARQLPDPCWTVIMADGTPWSKDGEWTPGCWSTRERAEQGLLGLVDDDRPGPFMEVIQEDFRCWHLTLICGAEFVFDGEVEQTHFEDRTDLLEAMEAENVVQLDGVGRYAIAECCADCKAEIDGLPVEPDIEVHPDQVPLIPGPGDTIPPGWS